MAAPHRFVDPTDFDLRLLRVFDAVARAGSFTAGEVMLNKSKSSISMDIAALETRLGLKLCRRGRAGFALTEHGRAIHDLCGELFRSLHDFRDRVGRVASHVGGSVTVVMDDNFPFGVQAELTGVVRSFNDAHPDVFLTLRTSSPDEVTQLIVDGSVDLGISAIPKPVPETQQHALFEEVMTLYCGARHPLFDVPDARLKRKQVAGFAFVDVASRQSPQAREFADEMRVAARAGTIHTRLLFVLTGKFLAFLPQDFARPWVARGEMRALAPHEWSYRHTCFAVARKDVALSAACERFLDELKRAFARE